LWPDFDGDDLRRAVEAFRRRKRRYGGLLPDEAIRAANRPRRTSADVTPICTPEGSDDRRWEQSAGEGSIAT
jgi:hypothetical protein